MFNYYVYRFYRKYHFPETYGCLDGTYVEIVCPRDDEEAFYDRKGQYSLHAQIVSNCSLRWPDGLLYSLRANMMLQDDLHQSTFDTFRFF